MYFSVEQVIWDIYPLPAVPPCRHIPPLWPAISMVVDQTFSPMMIILHPRKVIQLMLRWKEKTPQYGDPWRENTQLASNYLVHPDSLL